MHQYKKQFYFNCDYLPTSFIKKKLPQLLGKSDMKTYNACNTWFDMKIDYGVYQVRILLTLKRVQSLKDEKVELIDKRLDKVFIPIVNYMERANEILEIVTESGVGE